MSDATILRALLVANAPLAAVVAPEKIFFGAVKQGTVLPALVLNTISSVERKRVRDEGAFSLVTSRTQVTVKAKSYAEQKEVLRLLGLAVKGGRRVVAGVLVANAERDIVGPDLSDGDAGIFEQTQDFRLIYYQPL